MKTTEWYLRHKRDHFVKQAQRHRYYSRAAFKLLEIAKKTRLFTGVRRVLDLGAAPGSWSQVAAQMAPKAHILAVDLLPIKPVPGVTTLTGDLHKAETWHQITAWIKEEPVDLILSDMSANLSGIKAVDLATNQAIYDLLLEVTAKRLVTNGTFVCKIFGDDAGKSMQKAIASRFVYHKIIKPAASRNESSESYIWAKAIAKR